MLQCFEFPNLHVVGGNAGCQGEENPGKHLDRLWNWLNSYQRWLPRLWNGINSCVCSLFFCLAISRNGLDLWNGINSIICSQLIHWINWNSFWIWKMVRMITGTRVAQSSFSPALLLNHAAQKIMTQLGGWRKFRFSPFWRVSRQEAMWVIFTKTNAGCCAKSSLSRTDIALYR